MKKYLILLIMTALLGFTSCSDDDEDQDRVIGTWIIQSVEPSSFFDPSACAEDSTVEIEGNNTLTATFYFAENDCVGNPEDGTWQNMGGSSYTINFPGFEPISGTVTYPSSDKMVFTNPNVVFTFQRQL